MLRSTVDIKTDDIIRILMRKKEFIAFWEERCASVIHDAIEPENFSRRDKLVERAFELVRAADAASQHFLDKKNVYRFNESVINRDSSVTFDVKLQLERLRKRPTSSGCESLSRRLIQLVRLFMTRISKDSHVVNTHSIAQSFCDMLYQLERIISTNSLCSEEVTCGLRKAADRFNTHVVLPLWELLIVERNLKKKPISPISTSPLRISRVKPLSPLQRHIAGGFIRSPALNKSKKTPSRSSSVPTISAAFSHSKLRNSELDGMSKSSAAKSIEDKWSQILEAEPILTKAVNSEGSTSKLARTVSAQIVREVCNHLSSNGIILLKSDRLS